MTLDRHSVHGGQNMLTLDKCDQTMMVVDICSPWGLQYNDKKYFFQTDSRITYYVNALGNLILLTKLIASTEIKYRFHGIRTILENVVKVIHLLHHTKIKRHISMM